MSKQRCWSPCYQSCLGSKYQRPGPCSHDLGSGNCSSRHLIRMPCGCKIQKISACVLHSSVGDYTLKKKKPKYVSNVSFFSLRSNTTQTSNPKHLPMKLVLWSNLFWSQEDQRNNTMLRASKSFKEVVLWVILFVSRLLDTFLCHSHISAQLRIHQHTQKHKKTQTEKHN